jgi:molecular chaperone DnaK
MAAVARSHRRWHRHDRRVRGTVRPLVPARRGRGRPVPGPLPFQSEVDIVIFNGSLDAEAKIGKFILSEIPPVAKKEPKIEVTFDIDTSCALEVTAKDPGTGRSETVRIEDTTLLSPAETTRLAQRVQEQQERDDLRRQTSAQFRLAADWMASLETTAANCEAAWNEFRQRKAVFRAGSAPLDDETQCALAELFRSEHELAADLNAVLRPIPEVLRTGREFLSGTGTAEPTRLNEVTGLVERLGLQSDLVAELMAKLAAWNAALIVAMMVDADPIGLFRSHHDAGDYLAAVAALDRIQGSVSDTRDVRRQLRCLAEVGDTERFRGVLEANAARLGALPIALSGKAELADLVRRSLVQVRATQTDGSEVTGSGFLAGESVVLTCGSWLADPSGGMGTPSSIRVTAWEPPHGLRPSPRSARRDREPTTWQRYGSPTRPGPGHCVWGSPR